MSNTRTLARRSASAHAVEDRVDDLAEVIAILAHAGASLVLQRALIGLGVLEHLDRFFISAALFEVLDRDLGLEHLVRMRRSLGAFDAGRHLALDDQCVRAVVREDAAQVDVQLIQILAHHGVDGQSVAGERAREVVADHVLLRMAGDGDVVVIDEHLEIELLAHAKPRGFGVVPFHLRAVRTEHHDRLARIGHRHAIAERPHVPEPAGTEFDARRELFLRMSRQSLVVLAIVQQLLGGHRAVEYAEQILRRDAMPGLVIKDRHDRRTAGDEARG